MESKPNYYSPPFSRLWVSSFWALFSLQGTNEIGHFLTSSHHDIIPNLEVLGELRVTRNRFSSKCFDAIFDLQDGQLDDHNIGDAKKAVDNYKKALETYTNNSFMPEEANKYETVKDKFAAVTHQMEQIVLMLESKDPQTWDKARRLLQNEFNDVGEQVGKFNTEVVKLYEARAEQEGPLGRGDREISYPVDMVSNALFDISSHGNPFVDRSTSFKLGIVHFGATLCCGNPGGNIC